MRDCTKKDKMYANYQIYLAEWILFIGFCNIYDTQFLTFNEQRPFKVILNDKLLEYLPLLDITHLIHLSSAMNVGVLLHKFCVDVSTFTTAYHYFRYLMYSFIMSAAMRATCMYLCPLEVHPESIVLHDSLLEFITGHHSPYVHDLFFSGHMSFVTQVTMVVLHQCQSKHRLTYQMYGLFNSFLVASIMLAGKIHYTIDVLISPFLTYHSCHFGIWLADRV